MTIPGDEDILRAVDKFTRESRKKCTLDALADELGMSSEGLSPKVRQLVVQGSLLQGTDVAPTTEARTYPTETNFELTALGRRTLS